MKVAKWFFVSILIGFCVGEILTGLRGPRAEAADISHFERSLLQDFAYQYTDVGAARRLALHYRASPNFQDAERYWLDRSAEWGDEDAKWRLIKWKQPEGS